VQHFVSLLAVHDLPACGHMLLSAAEHLHAVGQHDLIVQMHPAQSAPPPDIHLFAKPNPGLAEKRKKPNAAVSPCAHTPPSQITEPDEAAEQAGPKRQPFTACSEGAL
jgi:hypothetical protein